jgi:hypothetical protein
MATFPLTRDVQNLMAVAEPNAARLPKLSDAERTALQTSLNLTQQELDRALATTSPDELHELIRFVEESIAAEHRVQWFDTPLPALRNRTPRQVILEGRTPDILAAFERLYEGIPA